MIRKRLNAMVERKKNRPSPPRGAAVQRSENRGERIENKLSKEKLQQEKNVKISTKCLHNMEGVHALRIQN